MTIKALTSFLESHAPLNFQESYDNSGLLVGNPAAEINGILICLDSTPEIIEEAIAMNCNLVIAHHPIIFKGLKKLNGKNYIEKTIIKAIKNDIAIYAIHTNLDNVYHQGVNSRFAETLGLVNTQILSPKKELLKLSVITGVQHTQILHEKLDSLNMISWSEQANRSFSTLGVRRLKDQNEAMIKLEFAFSNHLEQKLKRILNTTLKETIFRYEISPINNENSLIGSGLLGELKTPTETISFLQFLKKSMKTTCVKHTALIHKKIKTVAICGGSGSFLLQAAIARKADLFITADFKYHEFFDADGKIIIADIGHYETEQYTIELLQEIISKKFSSFAAHCTKINTNPVHYLV